MLFYKKWLLAWAWFVFFGEVLSALLGINPAFLMNLIPIILFWGFITIIFTWLFTKINAKIMVVLAFITGGSLELFLFGGIPNFIVAGLFYIFLLLPPYYINKKVFKNG